MQILPVLDLKQGQVVRGIGGRRQEYRAVVSRLTPSAEPLAVARAFGEHFGCDALYLADLDAIAGGPPAVAVYGALLHQGFRLWVDAGLGENGRNPHALAAVGVQHILAGLESLSGPEELRELLEHFSPARLVFSLDLKDGRPLGSPQAWSSAEAWDIAHEAVRLGVARILVLDLARVGGNQGTATDDLCCRLRSAFPHLEIATGGGIRGLDDLRRLRRQGVDYVLIASALHDGRLTRKDLAEFRGSGIRSQESEIRNP